MRFVPDAVRDILIFLEKNDIYEINQDTGLEEKKIFRPDQIADALYTNDEKYTYKEIVYATEKMVDEGYLIPASIPTKDDSGNYMLLEINDITGKGHELLGNIHNDTVWEVIKKKAKVMGDFSLKTLSTAAFTVGTTLMTEPNAIENFLKGIDNILKMIK